jgi:uncharacterized membrane protein YedE/YeeE
MNARPASGELIGLACGVTFAVGLWLSGMTDPGKVLGFLDVAGRWDPTLAFVMAGAVGVHFAWLRWSSRRSAPAEQAASRAAPSAKVDARLVTGAAIFGIGWGAIGYCPGPALVASGFGRSEAIWFSLAMLGGIAIYTAFAAFERRATSPVSARDSA